MCVDLFNTGLPRKASACTLTRTQPVPSVTQWLRAGALSPIKPRKAHQLRVHRVSRKGTSRSEKAHQPNVIPKSTARYGDTRLMHILHSNASTPMGDTIAR